MSNKKNGGDLRIFFQNIGTLKLGMQTDVSEEAVEIMHGLGVDIAGLTEINKNFGNSVVRGQADRIFQRNMGGAVIKVAENEEYVVEGVYKPGGVMAVKSRRMEGAAETSTDSLGRWTRTVVEMGDWKLTVYAVYVPSDGDLGGPGTIRRQLQHDVDRRGLVTHWKVQYYEHLVMEVRRDMCMGYEAIVGGGI